MTPTRPLLPPACCRHCGATSYRPVVARDERGAMTAVPGRYCCSGCQVEFADPASWRQAPDGAAPRVESMSPRRLPARGPIVTLPR